MFGNRQTEDKENLPDSPVQMRGETKKKPQETEEAPFSVRRRRRRLVSSWEV